MPTATATPYQPPILPWLILREEKPEDDAARYVPFPPVWPSSTIVGAPLAPGEITTRGTDATADALAEADGDGEGDGGGGGAGVARALSTSKIVGALAGIPGALRKQDSPAGTYGLGTSAIRNPVAIVWSSSAFWSQFRIWI
jgi:hypothetical protein